MPSEKAKKIDQLKQEREQLEAELNQKRGISTEMQDAIRGQIRAIDMRISSMAAVIAARANQHALQEECAAKKLRTEYSPSAVWAELPDDDRFVQFVAALTKMEFAASESVPQGLRVLKFTTKPPLLGSIPAFDEGILERACYTEFASCLCEGEGTFKTKLVCGTPGIGMTSLRVYLLWRWLTGQLPKIFNYVDFDLEGTGDSVFIERTEDGFRCFQHPCRRFHLDARNVKIKTLGLYELCPTDAPYHGSHTLVGVYAASLSAKQAWGCHLDKKPGFRVVVMSVWSKQEIEALAPNYDKKRFELYGGIPRLVVELSPVEAAQHVQQALNAMRWELVGVAPPSVRRDCILELAPSSNCYVEVKGFTSGTA